MQIIQFTLLNQKHQYQQERELEHRRGQRQLTELNQHHLAPNLFIFESYSPLLWFQILQSQAQIQFHSLEISSPQHTFRLEIEHPSHYLAQYPSPVRQLVSILFQHNRQRQRQSPVEHRQSKKHPCHQFHIQSLFHIHILLLSHSQHPFQFDSLESHHPAQIRTELEILIHFTRNSNKQRFWSFQLIQMWNPQLGQRQRWQSHFSTPGEPASKAIEAEAKEQTGEEAVYYPVNAHPFLSQVLSQHQHKGQGQGQEFYLPANTKVA